MRMVDSAYQLPVRRISVRTCIKVNVPSSGCPASFCGRQDLIAGAAALGGAADRLRGFTQTPRGLGSLEFPAERWLVDCLCRAAALPLYRAGRFERDPCQQGLPVLVVDLADVDRGTWAEAERVFA